MNIFASRVLTPKGLLENQVLCIERGMIADMRPGCGGDARCALAVPGLLDQHVHGGFGADVMSSPPEKMLAWLDFLLSKGVTRILAGVYTAPLPVMRTALQTMRAVMDAQAKGAHGARLEGIHLEGPFISTHALGAMRAECVLPPSVERYESLVKGYEDMIRLVTLAPEVPGACALAEYLRAHGVRVQAGHTAATAEEGARAFSSGVDGVTHFFNASTPIHHRAPGILTEALVNDAVYTECICDFVHVHPAAIRLIHRCKGAGRMMIVSDAVSTTGLPDGVYEDGGIKVIVKNGESRTASGALNGGGNVLSQEVKKLISIGIPEEDAFRMASATPASYLGLRIGAIAQGAQADILCMNERHEPILTVLGEQAREADR